MENLKLSNCDRIYVGALASICEKMDDLAVSENFDIDLARKLNNRYCKLAKKTYADSSRTEKDIDSWCLAFSHAYEPSSVALNLRVLSELQNKQIIGYQI